MTLLRSSCVLLTLACCDAKLDFFVMADWGGSETSPFTTDGELGCAKQMGTLKPVTDSQFVLAIGDNFYSHGVSNENGMNYKHSKP
jgi:tartrate-resistant acid phosphatase type 5